MRVRSPRPLLPIAAVTLIGLAALLIAGCGSEGDEIATGSLTLSLDAPPNAAGPPLTLDEVAVLWQPADADAATWQVIVAEGLTFDPAALAGGPLEIGDVVLPDGSVTAVRVRFHGVPEPVEVKGVHGVAAGTATDLYLTLRGTPGHPALSLAR